MKTKLITTFFIFCLMLCACNNKQESKSQSAYYSDNMVSSDDEVFYEMAVADSEEAIADYRSVKSYGTSNAAIVPEGTSQQRMIRKDATISITVPDPLHAMDQIISMTEELKGFVVSSSSSNDYYNSEITLPKAELTIRIPAEKLLDVLAMIEDLTSDKGKYVKNKTISGEDITASFVDTQSRLTSMEKTRDKLYEILNTAQNAEEALEVYQTIADVESDIEVLKGQIQYMSESVAYSSVTIWIKAIQPEGIQTVKAWKPLEIIKDAFDDLISIGKDLIQAIIYFIIVGIPCIIIIAIPINLIILLIRKLNKTRKSKRPVTNTDTVEKTKLE